MSSRWRSPACSSRTQRCPDGVELAADEEGRRFFRPRTDRREPVRLEMQDLENSVVVEFINARDDEKLTKFVTKFGGIYEESEFNNPQARAAQEQGARKLGVVISAHKPDIFGVQYDQIVSSQRWLKRVLVGATGDDLARVLNAINQLGRAYLSPIFNLAGEGGAPQMLLRCQHLRNFMTMEVAFAGLQRAKLATCEHCGDIILTGPLTGSPVARKILQRSMSCCSDACA